jgi:hypothetical protein
MDPTGHEEDPTRLRLLGGHEPIESGPSHTVFGALVLIPAKRKRAADRDRTGIISLEG